MAEGQSKPAPDLKNFDMTQVKPDLSRYSTYHWSKDQVAVVNLANHIRLVTAIQKQMKEHGYRIDTVKPDVVIQYKAERHTTVQTHSSQKPSAWDPTDLKVQVELSREEQVSLSITLVEAESGFLLWQAKGTYPLGTPDKAEKLINEAVEGLFSEYPKER
jgi:alkylated DNA repair dioxygenase AlkB